MGHARQTTRAPFIIQGGYTVGDRVLGGVSLVLAAFYVWQATVIQTSFISDPVGAKTFPIIIAALFAVSSLVMLLSPDADPVWPALPRMLELLAGLGVMVAYVYLLPSAGFLISTVIATTYLSWRLGAPPLSAAMAGIATSGGIYIVFHLVLGLSLAKGPFGV